MTLIAIAEKQISNGNMNQISLDGLAKLKTKVLVKSALIEQGSTVVN